MKPAITTLFLFLASLCSLPAQEAYPKKKKNRCTVCEHDSSIMEASNINHGPFIFGRSDSQRIMDDMVWQPIWMETKHYRLGGDFPKWKIPEVERKIYRAELSELQKKYPKVNPKTRTLDKWHRIHLLANRMERFYSDARASFGCSPLEFLDEGKNKRRGTGPYLGEKDKYEILVVDERTLYREYMTLNWGLAYVKPQRWNNVDRDCLWFGLSLEQEEIEHDRKLQNIVIHGLAHNLLDGYMHYSFELPVWLTEGYAHWAERENDPRYTTFCSVEGSLHEGKTLIDWRPEVRKLVRKNEAASFATLIRRASFAEIGWEDHLICWSKMDFLLETKPKEFGVFLTEIVSRRDKQGYPDGSNMDNVQRDGFKKHFGWTLNKAEEKWKEWVLVTYPTK
ncbi:MAG TPA: hypothetical protein QGG59_01570 [Planctomycetota bacterium]|nr:hypothetical protein [Planctomycetota bacterium]MDP6129679.1 hypothetical protein [Planctomycetota bacterium]MDP7246330.1 hypothetical protein [Planctomycetota bacterium]HJM38782.1 hypothetical protein [Planctomycetota bacterium]